MSFRPTEVLFSPTADCNLSCAHCITPKSSKKLPINIAGSFLLQCKRAGIKRVSFTGGEPLLYPEFLYRISSLAVKEGMLFGRIMTNGVWYKNKEEMEKVLRKLRSCGYDGDICVSVDAFHRQDIKKLALFIKTAVSEWGRPDMVSIAWVAGIRESESRAKVRKLLSMLAGLPVRTARIDLTPAGSAAGLKSGWSGKWFKEDYCKGPGNALFVTPGGEVKPCCGYANDLAGLTIGNIKKDSAAKIIDSVKRNDLVRAIFTKGLSGIRKKLENLGFVFPGKTANHCLFCYYLMTKVPKKLLKRAIAAIILLAALFMQPNAEAEVLKKSADYKGIDVKVIRCIPIPKWYHEGLLVDGDSILVANGRKGKIWVVNSASGKLISEIDPPATFTEAIVKTGDGSYLVTDWDDKKLYEVMVKDSKMSILRAVFDFAPSHPAGLVLADGRMFAIAWTRGMGTKFDILELDKDFKLVRKINIIDIQEPAHMAWDGKSLWITGWYNRRVYKVDPETWTISASFRAPLNKVTGIAWDGRYLWVTGTYADLYQVSVD